jgi:enamine deaminase RidA (YjgF/YER057c/UK114 family)
LTFADDGGLLPRSVHPRLFAASAAVTLVHEVAMIDRFSGLTPTRSRAVVHDGLVFTVAVAPDPVTASMYEQSVMALARIDESLALCGSDKSKILSAIVYITDIKRKNEMNRAWDEWVDIKNPPMRACIGVDLEPPHIVEIVVTATR